MPSANVSTGTTTSAVTGTVVTGTVVTGTVVTGTVVTGTVAGQGPPDTSAAVAKLIRFLETGSVPDGLFAPGVFCDLSLQQWRVQAGTAGEILALRAEGHPGPGQVRPRSTCSGPSRGSWPPSSMTCWPAPRTTGRARLAAALARCWAYAGQSTRAIQFADEAVDRAQRAGSAELVADCLDAALAAHWGPGELDMCRSLASRLDEVAAHVLDPGARLQAHLWGLQVAWEMHDVQAIHPQMRALEFLGEESARALFFAASRRLMLDLLRGRTDTTAQLTDMAAVAAEQAFLADAWMVLKAMDAYSAAFPADTAACAAGAAECEAFALAEGVTAVCAEAAFLWVFDPGPLVSAEGMVRPACGRVREPRSVPAPRREPIPPSRRR